MIDTMDKHSCELFLEDALDIGRRLVETGAEVKRVEDTVRRIALPTALPTARSTPSPA